MQSMFSRYDNLNANYIPDNSSPEQSKEMIEICHKLPKELFDVKGRFIGYSWSEGDTFIFPVTVNTVIKVDKDSIIYEKAGEHPTESTPAQRAGQQAYNIVDCISWTYVGRADSFYIWVKDDTFTYSTDGEVELTIQRDMTDKQLEVQVFNFRWEHIHSFIESGVPNIDCDFNKDITSKFNSSVYYCLVKITSKTSVETVRKFMLVVE